MLSDGRLFLLRSNVYLNSNHYCLEQCLPSQRIIGGFHVYLLVSHFVEQAAALSPVHRIVKTLESNFTFHPSEPSEPLEVPKPNKMAKVDVKTEALP